MAQTDSKESACNAGDPGSIPGSGRSPAVFLPGKFPGQRSLAGYSPWCHKESNVTEYLSTWMINSLLNREGRKENSGQRGEFQQGGDRDGEGKVIQIVAIGKWQEQ